MFKHNIYRLFKLLEIGGGFLQKEPARDLAENQGQDHTNRTDLFPAYNS